MATNPFITAEENKIVPGQVLSKCNTILCAVLVSTIQERCSHTGESEKEGHNVQRDGQHVQREKTEGVRSFLHGDVTGGTSSQYSSTERVATKRMEAGIGTSCSSRGFISM